ncbi:hypothetical protein A3E39_04035 [Candidatus Uhrbacteria bacterium RIFCSPHIGHO2_12_FULL_60_25]|uniref:Uncharacterized protein n=1 Tax=Candidatus Uhrbacteria bacterium RIFCSPHIGHO2_12_FULL_60_25 TaxID=1802399 RepID=A0A1F7UM74_9BACT|nr:MAG: hypothetical protein A3D73_02080 [Candidatus Uhrbacteria bacterium RIFCSPHIGHO2_02_FULL_60_44]OGL79362.1 MAG: hypothetical protein A3E39_04035 [Candidatus Uhrbacteria bacterium RIFCSPHIGHO2_12_FULL_60_25]
MTIANPKTPEAAQRLLTDLLEEPGALETSEDSAAKAKKAAPAMSIFDAPTLRPAVVAEPTKVPNVVLSIPEGDLLDFTDDEPTGEPRPTGEPARIVPPPLPAQADLSAEAKAKVDIVMAQTAQLTGIEPPPVSRYIPPVLDAMHDSETLKPAPQFTQSFPPSMIVEEGDLLEIRDDEPPGQEVKTETLGTPSEKPAEPDPEIEVREETSSQPPSIDVPVSSHGGLADNQVARERPPDFSRMEKPEFSADDMRRKHTDGGYVVETELLWKFLRHLDNTLSTQHVFLSQALEERARQRWLHSKKMAVIELFARGEAFRFLKGQQADRKRMIQLKDIEGIVGELTSLTEKEPDEERKHWFTESFKPAMNWVENQINMDVKLQEKKELTTAGKTPHGATPAPKPAPVVAPPAPAPKSEPEPPTVLYDMHASPDMTPPPQAVHTPPVAKDRTPAKEAEKTEPPKNPKPKKDASIRNTFVIAGVLTAGVFMAIGYSMWSDRPNESVVTTRPSPRRIAVEKRTHAPVVTPVVTDECHTVKLAGVYGKPLTDRERGNAPAWDCSKQGRFTLLTSDTGKVCGCTFKN